jgi:cell wall-associated NlpC family hydrolase
VSALAWAAAGLLLLPVLVIAAALGGEPAAPSETALADIPPAYLALYEQAALAFGLPWELLAGVGKVESDHGRDPAMDTPNGAGAVGPMQFEPATFAEYGRAAGAAAPSILDPRDAIFAAAALLVANGAPADTPAALLAYNHAGSYVRAVLAWADAYTAAAAAAAAAAPAARIAVRYALAQVGTPYAWGGDGPGGFDCSGLVQAAYAAAGIALPRVAQAQHDAGPQVAAGAALAPGDLVFFGTGPSAVEHVGIVISATEMVDAPHTGADVRIEPFDWPDYLGATRPAG